jgi:hypothetical protein
MIGHVIARRVSVTILTNYVIDLTFFMYKYPNVYASVPNIAIASKFNDFKSFVFALTMSSPRKCEKTHKISSSYN